MTQFRQPTREDDADAILALVREFQEQQKITAAAEIDKGRLKARKQAEREVEAEEEDKRKITSLRADQFQVKPTHWLWRDRFPIGGLSLLAGKGEVSKSTVFAQFAAWLTRGQMKGAHYGTPVDVAYVVNEDLLSETVVPRMIVHGADLTRVHFLRVTSPTGEDALSFPADADRLKQFIRSSGVAATFIDPLSANISVNNRNDQGSMRRVFQIVSAVAQETDTAIIGLAHTRKDGAADIVEALMGSSEQSNVARSVHGLVMDPNHDGARILSCEKSNLSNRTQLASLRFELESVGVHCTDGSGDINYQPRIKWLEEISETASDILGDALHGRDGVDECARWLYDYLLSQGLEARYADIRSAAPKNYSESMLKRARKKINVVSRRESTSPPTSVWELPLGTPPRMD